MAGRPQEREGSSLALDHLHTHSVTAASRRRAHAPRGTRAAHRAAFAMSHPSVERGAKVFAQTCAICHQIAGQGKIVGPQLDGIGARGLDRMSALPGQTRATHCCFEP